jgi:hypothetical protein
LITRFKTRTGSLYEYDDVSMKWVRLDKTDQSGEIRTESGICIRQPHIEVDNPVWFIMEGLSAVATGRAVVTSRVTEIIGIPEPAAA